MVNPNHKVSVGIIFGGVSGEHEISLLSARSILAALNPQKYEIIQIYITQEGTWLSGEDMLTKVSQGHLKDSIPVALFADPTRPGVYRLTSFENAGKIDLLKEVDVIFPVLHGTFGEDGTVQGLFEMAGLAYVGAGVVASAVGMDKGIFKDVMRANGLPVVESRIFTRQEIIDHLDKVIENAEEVAPYPLFVKPANLGSSVGVSKCFNRSDLEKGLMDSARYDRRILVERGVEARELEVSVLGNEAPMVSLPGEIIPADEFYSYNAKYHDDRSQLLIPAPLDDDQTETARNLAIQCFKAVDGAGMARVDLLMDRNNGVIYINEINTIPGFTQISMYPKLWEISGISYSELVDRLIDLALERKAERQKTIYCYQREKSTR